MLSAEAEQFDRDFGNRVRRYASGGRDRHRASNHRSAIENAPIVTLPDDDDEPSSSIPAVDRSNRYVFNRPP